MPGDQACGVLVGERRKRQRDRVRLASTPAGTSHEQLRPGAAEDEQRHPGRPVDEAVDELEQAVVGPVQVLEDEHGGALFAQCLEEAPPGGERFATTLAALRRCRSRARPAGCRWPVTQSASVGIGDERRDRVRQLPGRLVCPVAFENARLRLRHLAERPEADPLAVGQAAPLAPGDQLGHLLDDLQELGHEPALADAREHRRVSRAAAHAPRATRVRASRSTSTSRSRPTSAASGACSTSLPKRERGATASQTTTGSRLPLRLDRRRLAVLDHVGRGAVGHLTHQHAVDRRGRLDPGCGVDHVSRNHPLPLRGRASSETSASPVLTATRSSASASRATSRIASAARTARSGSSSCTTGAPKTATTASPMNFSTVPPKRSSSARTRA